MEVLAEIFNICEPDEDSLIAEISGNEEKVVQLCAQKSGGDAKNIIGQQIIESEFLKKHDKFDLRKIDFMKISAIEILLNLVQFTP